MVSQYYTSYSIIGTAADQAPAITQKTTPELFLESTFGWYNSLATIVEIIVAITCKPFAIEKADPIKCKMILDYNDYCCNLAFQIQQGLKYMSAL